MDIAARAGLAEANTTTYSAASTDYDRDGTQDVLIGYHGVGAKLWKNKGKGHYARVAKYAWPGGVSDRHHCAWADVDRNGRPDAYCAAGRGKRNNVKDAAHDNELWLQSRRGRFREVGTEWHAGDACGRGRYVAFLHANRDRYPDLFVGNATPRQRGDDPCDASRRRRNEESKLFINEHGKRFRYAPRHWDYGAGPGSRCVEVLDFNGDGWDDLFTCGEGMTPRLFAKVEGGGLVDVTQRHRFDWTVIDAHVVDLDGDRDPDVVTSSAAGFFYHRNNNRGFGPRRIISRIGVGRGRSVAAGDADADGDADVYGMVGRGRRGNPDDRILLNNDLEFTPLTVPAAGGTADDVIGLDPRGTGRAVFLVLNGQARVRIDPGGPVQLIRVVRR